VIYPPVETAALSVARDHEGYDLIVSALVPYKRVDLAVEAYNLLGKPLVVVGDGPDLQRLRLKAGSTVRMLGWRSDDEVREHFRQCRAVIFPGEEDFGIVPVEAIACGKPVVAYACGGALETVVERPDLRTGILFREQSVEALIAAVRRLDTEVFDPAAMHRFAAGFDREVYKRKMREYVLAHWEAFQAAPHNRKR
jgi:glycosyltransferase involved in cell wall biosynthesis